MTLRLNDKLPQSANIHVTLPLTAHPTPSGQLSLTMPRHDRKIVAIPFELE
jgi:hypothetical protein